MLARSFRCFPIPTQLSFAWLMALVACSLAVVDANAQTQWPTWRGPAGNGTSPAKNLPSQWSDQEHVAWRLPLPGRGASTPIDFANRLILTMGIEGENTVMAVDRGGKIAWRSKLGQERAAKHAKASSANSSPVTDGELLYAYFKSGDLGCFTADGSLVWSTNIQKAYGEDSLWWDLGTSPILTDRAVVITVMQTGPSFLVALDKKTGKELWKADRWLDVREEANQAYTTPTLVALDGSPAIVTVGADHVTAHDAKNGELLWKLGGFNPANDGYFRSIASPVVSNDLLICPYARGSTLTGVKAGKALSDSERVAWRLDIGSDVPTPTVWNGKVYLLTDKGVVYCLDPKTGNTLWKESLPKSNKAYSSSPLIADGKLYCTREDATTFVLGQIDGPSPKLLSENKLDGFAVASPIAIENRIYLRTYEALYCFE